MARQKQATRITRRQALSATIVLTVAVPLAVACSQAAPAAAPTAPAAAPSAAPAGGAPTVAPAAPTVASAAAGATAAPATAASPASAGSAAGAPSGGQSMADKLGKGYIAYPETKGSVDFSNCWGGARIPIVQNIWLKPFAAIYPNISVQNGVTDCPPLVQKQAAAIASGSPPNTMMIQGADLPFFVSHKAIDSIDDLMARDKIDPSWYYASELKTRTYGGKTYGLPNVTGGAQHLLYYNTGLMKKIGLDPTKVPTTWQDLDAMVAPAKEAGLLVMDPAKVANGFTFHEVATYMNGGKYWDEQLTKVLWNSPEALEAAEWELQFVKAQAGKYANVAIAGADPKNTIEASSWKPQKYLAAISGSWFMFQLKSGAPEIQYGVTTFPTNAKNPNSKLGTPSDGGWAFCIATAGSDKPAAWEWIKFTTTSKQACEFVIAQQRPSPVISCNEDPRLSSGNPGWKAVQDDLAHNIAMPVAPNMPDFLQMWYDMEDAFLYEKMTPKEALDSYAKKGQQMLDDINKGKK